MEQLLLVNPKPKRKRKRSRKGNPRRQPAALARYWATHRRGRRRISATNPRRKKRRSYASNPGHHYRRRRHRSNPRFRTGISGGMLKGLLIPGTIGAGGAVALDIAMSYANPYLPASLQAGWFNVAVKGAAAVGIGMLAGKVMGKDRGRVVTLGGLTVVLYGAIRTALAGKVPGLSGYADYTPYPLRMGAYMPGPTGTPGIRGLGYVSPAPTLSPRMGAYMPRMPMNVAPAMGDYGDGM